MITITKQPTKYTASENKMIFELSSTSNDVIYYNVVIYDISNEIISKQKIYLPPTSNNAIFDLSRILKNYVSTPLNKYNTSVVHSHSNTLSYYLKITSVNGAGTEVDDEITSPTYNVYRGFTPLFGVDDRYYFEPLEEAKFLTNSFDSVIHHSEDINLFFIADNLSGLAKFKITTNYSNNSQSIDYINFINSSNFLHQLVITPDDIASTNSQLTTNINSIYVQAIGANEKPLSIKKRFYLKKYRCNLDIIKMHFTNILGGVDSYTFTHSNKSLTTNKTYITNNSITNNKSKSVIHVNKVYNYSLITQALNDNEYDYLVNNILQAEEVYIEDLNGNYQPVIITNNSMQILRKRDTKKFNYLTINIETENEILISSLSISNGNNGGFDYKLDFEL